MKTCVTWTKVLVVCSLLSAWMLTAAGPLQAAAEDRKSLREFAGIIKKFLDERHKTNFFLGDVASMPPNRQGPAVRLILKEELQKLGVKITCKADYGFTGSFRRVGEEKQIELRAMVVNQDFETELMIPFRFDTLPELPKEIKGRKGRVSREK